MKELLEAMIEVNDLNKSKGVTQRGGKKYTEVFVRIEAFRKAFGTSLGVETEIVADNGKNVVIKAMIKNSDGMIIGCGYAEEVRGTSNVNKTSAIENCETSAVGRALASLGLHGGQYASINEVVAAQRKEEVIDADWEAFTAERIAEIPTITNLDELKQWDDHFSSQLDRLHLEVPKLYDKIQQEVNKRKAFL